MPIFKQTIDVLNFVDPQTQEDQEFNKPYLLLLTPAGGYDYEAASIDDGYKEFTGIGLRGRRLTFDYLKDQLGNDDLIHSYVLSGKIPLGKEVSLYTFLRLCITQYFSKSTDGLTLEDLNALAYETSGIDPDKVDLDILFSREANRPK